ncbi:MAG: circadian clock protein KaiC [Geobacteraceae bacterium]|nr:circadian clock protein KaiC [Geobacteraceae bacterium]
MAVEWDEKCVEIEKSKTGIDGLDQITGGGLPKRGATLVAGNVGCGKTMLAMQFLVNGALLENEPGVFLALEESNEELKRNFASIGVNLQSLIDRGLLTLLNVDIKQGFPEEPEKTDMGGWFIRLADAIASIKAKRVAIDIIDTLFQRVTDDATLRLQLRGLFHWLKELDLTVVCTAEAGAGTLTQRGMEEYIADCVVKLDYRVTEQLSTRRLRVIKYRGAGHPSDEFPFVIDNRGISLIPITSIRLEHEPSGEYIPTGIAELDNMLQGKGFSRGSSILLTGTPGSGKTSMTFSFLDAACRRGERCVYFGFEESAAQTLHNMKSIGLDLQQWVEKGLLQLHTSRISMFGLETHLITMYRLIEEFRPAVVIVDPMPTLTDVGSAQQAKSVITRLIDFLKMRAITTMFTDQTRAQTIGVVTEEEIPSLFDTWLLLRDREVDDERFNTLLIFKSRGIAHSKRVCEFLLTDNGIRLKPLTRSLGVKAEG